MGGVTPTYAWSPIFVKNIYIETKFTCTKIWRLSLLQLFKYADFRIYFIWEVTYPLLLVHLFCVQNIYIETVVTFIK